jgi:hypothetical protein
MTYFEIMCCTLFPLVYLPDTLQWEGMQNAQKRYYRQEDAYRQKKNTQKQKKK